MEMEELIKEVLEWLTRGCKKIKNKSQGERQNKENVWVEINESCAKKRSVEACWRGL